MRQLFTSLLLIFTLIVKAQKDPISDKLLEKICNTIKEDANSDDSTRVSNAFSKHLFPVFEKLTEEERLEAMDKVIIRLQRNCIQFTEIMFRMNPSNSDWQISKEKPVSVADRTTCEGFKKFDSFSYLEGSGDTTTVRIKNGIWTDYFKDGTYSRLKFRWIQDCEFQLEFIESTNLGRKYLSKKGEKYNYQILNKGNGFYNMSAEVESNQGYMTFRLYTELNP